jgi:zinc/manganese transport system substrate-binding protein
MRRRDLLAGAAGLAAGLAALSASVRAQEPVPVVASFSILADMVRQVGGERVAVTTLVGPNGDAHVYQPTPADAKALARARLLVLNGLGFEGWMARLQRSSGFKGAVAIASTGAATQARAEDDHGHAHSGAGGRARPAADPHAWQNLANAKVYAANIRDALAAADPEGRAAYAANAARFAAAVDVLDAEVRAALAGIPAERRKVITTHDAFGYFGRAYGVTFLAPESVSTEAEASARDVAAIIRQIRADKVPAVFIENVTDPRLLEQIGRETGVRIGGTLFSDALSGPEGPAATYLDMVRHNVRTLVAALAP